MAIQIDILYIKDCTSWETADDLLRQALADLGIEAEIAYWVIESDHQAIETHFNGSPSFQVDGYDLFPVTGAPAGMTLRAYNTEEGILDYPTYTMLREALQNLS